MNLVKRSGMLALFALAALLAGCRSDSASHMINGADQALTLVVDQEFFWDEQAQLGLIIARQPDCQRRHKLQPAPLKGLKVELYQTLEGGYVFKEGQHWYIGEAQKCQMQQYKTPPAEPGELLGAFEFKDDKLSFVAAPKKPAPPAAPPPAVNTEPPAAPPTAPAAPAAAGGY